MMKKYLSISFLAMILLLNSCEGLFSCLEGDGDIVSEDRFGGSFTSVQVEGDFNVHVEYAATTSVEVTTNENLTSTIETVVRGGKLLIRTDYEGCVDYSSQTKVLVKCPNLSDVIQMGSGNIEVLNFSSEHFSVTQSGSGNITISKLSVTDEVEVTQIGSGNVWLSGRANGALYMLSGSGNIDAEAMRVFNCTATSSGSGNIHTYVYDLLKVTLTGSGSVYYYGNTKDVVKHVTGSGDVVNRSYNSTN